MRVVTQAVKEMTRVGMDPDDIDTLARILEIFFARFDSGGAVSVAAPQLQRLIAGAPLTPLTGDDDEWEDRSETEGSPDGTLYQNRRASSVFRRRLDDGSHVFFDVSRPYDPEAEDHEVGSPVRGRARPSPDTRGFYKIRGFPYLPVGEVGSPVVGVVDKGVLS